MIEVISGQACIDCDKCVDVCPTNVFEAVPGGHRCRGDRHHRVAHHAARRVQRHRIDR
ncbi:MAG: 4Fe-4S dicluster domain-containing protein [Streptosporangiaceae bacterium]